MPETDEIYRAYNFVLDISGIPSKTLFAEVSGLSVSVDTIEYREGGGGPVVQKLPGRVKYGDVTLKWGMSDSIELWDWLMATTQGTFERKNITVTLLRPDETTGASWNLINTFPSDWRGARLDAMGDQVAIETLTLAVESLERV